MGMKNWRSNCSFLEEVAYKYHHKIFSAEIVIVTLVTIASLLIGLLSLFSWCKRFVSFVLLVSGG